MGRGVADGVQFMVAEDAIAVAVFEHLLNSGHDLDLVRAAVNQIPNKNGLSAVWGNP
jgi:hypothetical protein